MTVIPLHRVHSFNVFAPTYKIWMHSARCTFTGFWKCEATQQDGRMVYSKLITEEYMHDIWRRSHHIAEATYFT